MPSTLTTPSTREKAIVVGGGPVGLATALMLANEPHCYDVCLYESTSGQSAAVKYDATKAYLYNVNLRGQSFTRKFPNLLQKRLVERGVESNWSRGFTIVPADPNKPIPKTKNLSVNVNKDDYSEENIESRVSYWIPRHAMIEVFMDAIEEYDETREEPLGKIQIFAGKECVKVQPCEDENLMAVTVRDTSTDMEYTRKAKLVVGADGIHSKVRDYLSTKDESYAKWNVDHEKFNAKKWISPATGLRIKVLQFPPKFPIKDSDGSTLTTHSENTYAIRSINTRPKTYLSLGLLPMKDNNAIRPCNIITRPNHEIWTMTEGEQVRQWFQTAFPRMPFHKGGMISEEEWDRFAKAQGTRFPFCQRCDGLQVSSPDGECGVVLVGDAIHAFPPDIGQGINAGLSDVVALDEELRGVEKKGSGGGGGTSLGDVLREYETKRAPEVKALIRLARFGSPYQYKQPLRIDKFRRRLWTMNVVLRLFLNKITFGIIPTSAIMLSQNPKLSFRQVMFRADMVTLGLTGILGYGFFWGLRKLVLV